MITLQDLIKIDTDLFENSRVKLVRHKDGRKEYKDLLKDKNALLEYQQFQAKETFKDVDYLISFIGQERSKSLLFGIFKVGEMSIKNGEFFYDLQEVKVLEDFIDRLIIDWGKSTITWHQWYHKNHKEVVEILPKGYLGEFSGLTNFVLDFQELKKMISNPDANRDWKNHLSSVNGIYMILDKKTGRQYIGSAYGQSGIWQRWSEYANTKHGGNKTLIELLKTDDNYHKNFQYTVLQSLPSNLSSKEVIAIENLYKEKFGTRAHGLNEN